MNEFRDVLIKQVEGGQAFETFDQILESIPQDKRGVIPNGAEHSAWQIAEHMRIALADLVSFSTNEDGHYAELKWPDEYWPGEALVDWDGTVRAYKDLKRQMQELIRTRDLAKPFSWGDAQTILREAMLAVEHEAYHLGELVMLQRLLSN